jgi:hypothetical protein
MQLKSEEDPGRPVVWVSFCPDLGIYHYHNETEEDGDPLDLKFTRDELIDVVAGMMQSKQVTESQQLTVMCAWARLFAHKVVVFYQSGLFRVHNPEAQPPEEKEESDDMKEFFAKWQTEHASPTSIPTVAAYPSSSKKNPTG